MILTTDAIAGPAVVDLAYLETSSFGRNEFVLQAIDILLDQLPAHVRDLDEAYRAADGPQLKLTAHKIKSAAALLGMDELKRMLVTLETSTPEELRAVRDLVRNVSAACALALDDLKAERYKYL